MSSAATSLILSHMINQNNILSICLLFQKVWIRPCFKKILVRILLIMTIFATWNWSSSFKTFWSKASKKLCRPTSNCENLVFRKTRFAKFAKNSTRKTIYLQNTSIKDIWKYWQMHCCFCNWNTFTNNLDVFGGLNNAWYIWMFLEHTPFNQMILLLLK